MLRVLQIVLGVLLIGRGAITLTNAIANAWNLRKKLDFRLAPLLVIALVGGTWQLAGECSRSRCTAGGFC